MFTRIEQIKKYIIDKLEPGVLLLEKELQVREGKGENEPHGV